MHLRRLDMSECDWLKCTMSELAKQLNNLIHLEHLNLSGCNNVKGSISDLSELKRLTSLNVWCCDGILLQRDQRGGIDHFLPYSVLFKCSENAYFVCE
jgi:hypothetical protein